MGDWTVWGDGSKPVLEGTEEECKAYVVANIETRLDIYIADPKGAEWDYDPYSKKWEKL